MKYAEITLPYYKQGCDLDGFLEQADGNIIVALKNHAEMLNETKRQLELIAEETSKFKDQLDDITIEADVYFNVIAISGPDNFIENLIEQKLAYEPDCDYEEEAEIIESI